MSTYVCRRTIVGLVTVILASMSTLPAARAQTSPLSLIPIEHSFEPIGQFL